MISTVTTSTVSTITTIALAGSIALIGILVLLILLIQKEVISSSRHINLQRLSKVLYIGIVPLFVAFFLTVVVKVVQVLQ
jgi:hypothetical protein